MTNDAKRSVYLTRRLPEAVERQLHELYRVRRNEADSILTTEELIEAAKGCAYIITSAMQPIQRSVFTTLRETLLAVGTLSVGFNHIDLDAARECNVRVFYSPGVLSDACAELAMMLLLNAARRGHEADTMVREGRWAGYAPTQLLGVGLSGRRAGILGMGRIGQALAQRLKPFGVAVHYHNRNRLNAHEEGNATFHTTPESLLPISDFFFLLAPASPELKQFLNRERIEQLPQNAIVVNISRGEAVDDDAMIEALQNGRLFAAGLDVFQNEPKIDARYAALPNVFLTPHIASATTDTRNAMGFLVLKALLDFESGRTVENQLC